jgi:broad specificity phosphatase PhoE
VTRTIVHLVRHGQVHNPDGVLYGRLPGFRLSAAGEEMAVRTATALASRDIVLVRSSPLERARQTAAPLAEMLGLTVEVDDRLIESDNVFEGTARGWRDPGMWRHLYNPFRPSWGEPYEAVAARVTAACTDACHAAAGHEAVLVSHQLPIWVTRLAVQHERLWHRPDRRECALGSVTSFTYEDSTIVEVGYDEPAGAVGRRTVGGA